MKYGKIISPANLVRASACCSIANIQLSLQTDAQCSCVSNPLAICEAANTAQFTTDVQCSCVSNPPAICEAANTAQFTNGCAMQLCF